MAQTILVEKAEGVLTITFNRPEKKNALTGDMFEAMADAFEQADGDREIRAILLQGNGDSFTAGHDLGEFAEYNAGAEPEGLSSERMLLALAGVKKPLIAAAQGRGVGIGLTILLHCDLVYVAEDALFSSPFINLALVPEAASSLLLPARIGHVRAFQLFALGEPIDGRTAAAWGIANAAVPAADLRAKARAAALAVAARPPASVGLTKALMRDDAVLKARIAEEIAHFRTQLRSPEAEEAFAAFFQKRPADFSRF
jgi:enoyl-CoA hydratase/carnithine racemase